MRPFTLDSVALRWCAILGAIALALPATGPVGAQEKEAWAVPTFECLGLYYNSAEDRGECTVQYRPADEREWREALPLVYAPREQQYRGSLVGLKPGTEYAVRLECGGRSVGLSGRTRGEQFPIGQTTHLPGGELDTTVQITEAGTADGWHLVAPTPGAKTIIDVFNLQDYCVEVAADYVIVRGLELKNAGQHGVLIRRGVKNVVVEDCHITKWGRVGGARVWGVFSGSDSAVSAETGAGGLIVQRNLIEHPRGGANDWESGHPSGPQAITLRNSSGGNIIRYNDIRSTEDHGYNDGFGGGSNFSLQGSPNRDSDIYGNIITNCWDDAIEAEGANVNVRIWGNYIDQTFMFVATAGTSMGPAYIFRNVFGRSRLTHQDPSGGGVFKVGGRDIVTPEGERIPADLGRRYIFHNTVLQPNGALNVFGSRIVNAVSRNNIFRVRGDVYPNRPADGPPNDFDHDITRGYLGAGFVRSMFVPSDRLEWFLSPTMDSIKWGAIPYSRSGKDFTITDPVVRVPNPAIDGGERLPGFNDDYKGDAPDIGAFENGNPPVQFGREAAPGFTRAPWETQ